MTLLYEGNRKWKLSLPSSPKMIFPFWQLSKEPSSKTNLLEVFLYLEQSSFPARLALKYICISFLQRFLLSWKQGSHNQTYISDQSIIIISQLHQHQQFLLFKSILELQWLHGARSCDQLYFPLILYCWASRKFITPSVKWRDKSAIRLIKPSHNIFWSPHLWPNSSCSHRVQLQHFNHSINHLRHTW